MRRVSASAFWPVRQPRLVALLAVSVFFLAGLVAIIVTDAAIVHLGSLLIGCVALATILASVLDRRTAPD